MSKNNPAKKVKKHSDELITEYEAVCNEFFLGDIVSTFLPIGIIAILRYSFGTLDRSILLISEWAYASIIISSLALTRLLELKVMHQRDTSLRAVALSRVCIVLVIFSTICLAFYTLKEQNIKIDDCFIVKFQYILLGFSVFLLYRAHSNRESLNLGRKRFPENISESMFHWYVFCNLTDSRDYIRATCAAFNKKYDFTESNDTVDDTAEHEKKELDRLIEDIQNDLAVLQQRRIAWKKPPYDKAAAPEAPDDSGQ